MSAQPIPQPASWLTSIKAACFTPLSYYERCLDLDYTQLLIFSLVTVETLGANPPRSSTEIWPARVDEIAATFRKSREWIYTCLQYLVDAGLLKTGKSERGGRTTYSVRDEYLQEAKNAGRKKIPGRCPDCKTVGLFSTEFIPTPHVALRKLGGCVDSATFRCVMTVCRYTCQWNRENRCIEIKPAELDLADFSRLTGLEKREITTGLTTAVKLGLIGRELRAGRPSLFWAVPEKFGALDRRELRIVTPNEGGVEKEANSEQSKNSEKPSKYANTHANESGVYFYGRCENCHHLVTVEPVSESEFADSVPKDPPKQPPARAGKQKSAYQLAQDAAFEQIMGVKRA